MKFLIAYFSRKGANYVGGKILDLKKGNTEIAAEKVQAFVGGDLFEIVPTEAYPDDYYECIKVAKEELSANARPQIKNLNDGYGYDGLILCYPNWWGTMPMPVFTFLENCDLNGKHIYPLCTNEGSGMGVSEEDIKKVCPGAFVMRGLSLTGGSVSSSDGKIEEWLRRESLID